MTDRVPVGWPLAYWQSQEYFDVKNKLDALERDEIPYNPPRCDIFRSLELCPFDLCDVAFIGESPYPNPDSCSGVGFAARKGSTVLPASLRVLIRELRRDLRVERWDGDSSLERWCDQGVLLWNVIPTVEISKDVRGWWKGYPHKFWTEWPPLTKEIIQKLSNKGDVVFVFFGSKAAEYSKYVNVDNGVNVVLEYAHPSPLARGWRNHPNWIHKQIEGSRLFSTVNAHLQAFDKEPVNWLL